MMNILFTISDEMGKEVTALQSTFGMKRIEDLTIHAWKVLRYLSKTIRNDRCTLSPEAIHWISQSSEISPSTETWQELSHEEIDTRILQKIHRLLDDDKLDQALKATRILQLLKSHTIQDSNSQLVKSEMLLTAAETFVAECDPEKAAQLIFDATNETTDGSADGRYR
jgi:hypothetical protein